MGPGTEEGSLTGLDCCPLPLEPYDPADLMTLEVLVACRDDVWSLQRAFRRIKEKTFGYWSKALPLSADNYSSFERQLLGCYWAVLQTECLTMDHQVTMQHNLVSMSRVLCDRPSHKVRHT